MAISNIAAPFTRRLNQSAANILFERLPDRLFAVLASANRRQYWGLLCRLYETRFGPDAPLPPSHGFLVRDVVQDIEDAIIAQDMWEEEDGYISNTPINSRATTIFNRLVETGWFQLERHRMEKNVTMRPVVAQLLTTLISFAETGPVFLSGKIRSIDLNIQQVIEGNADGDTLSETAEQTRNLLEHVRNTGVNIRDVMESLNASTTTAQYVQRFFADYIETLFIGDYRELRTREHPLSRRPHIIRSVESLQSDELHRERLIKWYEMKRCGGDKVLAERQFEKDIHRLLELRRIDEYLDRLDDEIRRANRRALAFLDYRLRSSRRLDHFIKLAIDAVSKDGMSDTYDPFPPGDMVNGERLAEPRKIAERAPPSALRREVPSITQIAKARLTRKAREARSVTAPKLTEYVVQALNTKRQINSDELPIVSVQHLRCVQTLHKVGLWMSTGSVRLYTSAKSLARGFNVRVLSDDEKPGEMMSGKPFLIETTPSANQTTKEKAE